MAVYPGYIPPNTELLSGDYTTSPSGTYYGYFINGIAYPDTPIYNFWIVPGSNPSVAPCCFGYQPITQVSTANLGGYFAHMQTDGNFVVYTSATGRDVGTVAAVAATNSQQAQNGPFFAHVGDDGSFSIFSGLSPSVQSGQVFTAPNASHGAVTGINLTDIKYDFNHAKILGETGVGLYNADFVNESNAPDQVVAQQNISYSQTASFSFSVADAVGESISANSTIGIPGIAKESLRFTISNTTTITHGHADSSTNTVTFIAGSRPVIPPLETFNVQISGTSESYSIPYSWSGVATYKDGTTANVVGDGTFTGGSEGNFQVTTQCVIAVLPQTCDPGITVVPAEIFSVPAPSALAIAAPLFLGLLAGRIYARRRSSSSDQAPGPAAAM